MTDRLTPNETMFPCERNNEVKQPTSEQPQGEEE